MTHEELRAQRACEAAKARERPLNKAEAHRVRACLALAATMSDRCDAPPELKAKLWTDLVRPNVKLLAEFCSNVTFDDAGQDA